jgi:HEAT repeat protein
MQINWRRIGAGTILLLLTLPAWPLQAAEPTIQDLTNQLKSPKAKTRRKAAEELGKTNSREAVPPLLPAVDDPDQGVRLNAVRSLGQLRDKDAITMLLKALDDPDAAVRDNAILSLVALYVDPQSEFVVTRMAKEVVKTLNPFSDKVKDDPTVVDSYTTVNQSVTDGIAKKLRDSDEGVQIEAAYALGILRAQNAVPAMLETMLTATPHLKIALLRSFYKIKDLSVDEKLLRFLNDPNTNVQFETIQTLGLLRSKKAIPTLQKFYEQQADDKLRLKSLEAMALIGDPSLNEIFRRNLKDPEAAFRQCGAEGLGRSADPTMQEELSRTFLAETKTNVQLALSFALYQSGRKEYLDRLIKGLTDKTYRQYAEAYLIEIGKPALDALIAGLSSPTDKIRERLCYVLGMIGDPKAAEPLRGMMHDGNQAVVTEASLAVRRVKIP